MWVAVWGFGSTQSECGELGRFDTREEAQQAADAWLSFCNNPACGAWVRQDEMQN